MTLRDARSADLVLIDGRILTMDAHDTVAQAVAVRDEKIVAVGSNAEIEPLASASTQAIDLDETVDLYHALGMRICTHAIGDIATYTAFQEQTLGSREVGKLADLVVLGDDPLTFAPERFQALPVDVTIVGGKVVHTGAVSIQAGARATGVGTSCSSVHG